MSHMAAVIITAAESPRNIIIILYIVLFPKWAFCASFPFLRFLSPFEQNFSCRVAMAFFSIYFRDCGILRSGRAEPTSTYIFHIWSRNKRLIKTSRCTQTTIYSKDQDCVKREIVVERRNFFVIICIARDNAINVFLFF